MSETTPRRKKSTVKKAAPKKKKASRKKKIELEAKNLKAAHYNPRHMDDKARGGLQKSMVKFNDISGITWNQRSGNIVTGHHRWEELANSYGIEKLTFEHLKGDRYAIMAGEEDTGYTLRAVDWDKTTEKAANVTANSGKVEGIFTIDLKSVLEEIKLDIDEEDYKDLRLEDLHLDHTHTAGKGLDEDDDWDSDIEKVEKTKEDDHQTKFASITVTCEDADKDRVLQLIEKGLKGIDGIKIT